MVNQPALAKLVYFDPSSQWFDLVFFFLTKWFDLVIELDICKIVMNSLSQLKEHRAPQIPTM